MNNFERCLKILQEHSLMSKNYTPYIMYMLFHNKHSETIEKEIEQEFPITNDSDREKIVNVYTIIFKITGITINDFNLLESNFPSSDDMLLSILNKYFTSNRRIQMRSFLKTYYENNGVIQSEHQILFLWTKFNIRFGEKPKSDAL